MGERKVLNKYFPPDFDPSKLPKDAARRFGKVNIRMMLPFSLCCKSCSHFMYAGKKFNSRKEVAKGMDYLGIDRHRFIIKCEVCMNRISFLTDPKNTDYECESGATRNFSKVNDERLKLQKELREKEKNQVLGQKLKLDDKVDALESRTEASKKEIEDHERLERIQDLSNKRAKFDWKEMESQKRKEIELSRDLDDAKQLQDFKMQKYKMMSDKLDSQASGLSMKRKKVFKSGFESSSEDDDDIASSDEDDEVVVVVKKKEK